MRGPIILILFMQSCLIHAQLPKVAGGTFVRYDNFSSAFVPARIIDVWLPEGYRAENAYPVLYMHDGQMLFDSTITWNGQEWAVDETVQRLINADSIKQCIVVGIWNISLRRHTEYFPQKVFDKLSPAQQKKINVYHDYAGNPYFENKKPDSDNYLKFIVNELKPFIDSTYSTLPDKQNTFIMGSSMGGLISMYAICEYPEIFGGAACLSTHWTGLYVIEGNKIPDGFLKYLKKNAPSAQDHKIYFDLGTETLDALYPTFQKKADIILEKKGYNETNYLSLIFPGDAHNEFAWRNRLSLPMLFLLSK